MEAKLILKNQFGKTGHLSSMVLFGAAALWSVTQAEADQILELPLEYA